MSLFFSALLFKKSLFFLLLSFTKKIHDHIKYVFFFCQRNLAYLLKHCYILNCKYDYFCFGFGLRLGERMICIIFNFNVIC